MFDNFFAARKKWVFIKKRKISLVGRILDFVINSNNLKIEAVWVKSIFGDRILFLEDIQNWGKDRVIISALDSLVKSDEAPALENIFDEEEKIVLAKVFEDKQGTWNYVGKVANFIFDTKSFFVRSLLVKKGWFFFARHLLIPQSFVQKITDEGIFVSDLSLPVKTSMKDKLLKKTKMLPEMIEKK